MQGFYGMRLTSRHFGEGTLKDWNGRTVTDKFFIHDTILQYAQ